MRSSREIQRRAVELRQEETPAERLLWEHLRKKQRRGRKFRRQHPLDRFIVDFYCASCRLVVEVDGEVHQEQEGRDKERSLLLEQRGITIIRFSNRQVLQKLEEVVEEIERICGKLEAKENPE